jgi:hypothetical protein
MVSRKKILAIVMLLLVVAPLFFCTAYLVKQKIIQHNMHERLEASSLQTIKVKQIDLRWEKMDKEAIVNGELFDVKYYTVKDGLVILTGLYDNAEKKLKNDFAKLLHKDDDSQAPLEKLLLKFIFASAIVNNIPEANIFKVCLKVEYCNYKQVSVFNSLVVFTPPPNILLN